MDRLLRAIFQPAIGETLPGSFGKLGDFIVDVALDRLHKLANG
jgi:hypothetical protein